MQLSEPRGSWFERHWKAVACCGCVGGVVAVFVAFGALFLVAGGTAVFALRSTTPYATALDTARSDARVRDALGEPIEDGFMPQGSISIDNETGEASLTNTLSGPDGSGTLVVEGRKDADGWSYDVMEVRLADGRVIDLLRGPAPRGSGDGSAPRDTDDAPAPGGSDEGTGPEMRKPPPGAGPPE